MELTQVKCSHILQKHSKSRRPFDSFRNKKVTRSPEEAQTNINNIREELVQKGDSNLVKNFQELALKYSECSSAAQGGDLGYFSKGDMQKAFEDSSFKLKVGEMSQSISTDSGIHIILRTA